MIRWIALLSMSAAPALVFAQGGQVSLAAVSISTPKVTGGNPATVTVTLSGAASGSGLDVGVASSSAVATLASTQIHVPAGQSSGSIQVNTRPTATAQAVTITATARGQSRTANLTVDPPNVSKLEITPSSVVGGQTAGLIVSINGAAPEGGIPVNLGTTNSVITVPSSLTIQPGRVFASTTITTGVRPTPVEASVTAATSGGLVKTLAITVRPPEAELKAVSFLQPSYTSRQSMAMSVALTVPSSTQLPIQLAPNMTGGCPLSDTIPAGSQYKNVHCIAPATSVDTMFRLSVTYKGSTKTASVRLNAPYIRSISFPDTIMSGYTRNLSMLLTAPGRGPYPVTITSDNAAMPSPGPVAATVSSDVARYELTANNVTQPTTVTLKAAAKGFERTTTVVVIPAATASPAAPLQISSLTVSPSPVRGGGRLTITVGLSANAPATGTRVELEVPTVTGFKFPPAIIVAPGSKTGSVSVTMPAIIPAPATFTIGATLNGGTRKASVRIEP